MSTSITIIGPTASGKSAMAIALAKEYSGEIISADSRQIYRGMDIGSGKEPGRLSTSSLRGPFTKTAYLSGGIAHYMIDIVHPNTPYNVSKFVTKAQRIRDDIWHRKKYPIIAGGTMFWAQALVENNRFANVAPNPPLRKKLQKHTAEKLLHFLEKKDPRRAHDIKAKNEHRNKQRLIRALEIVDALGSVPPQQTPVIDPENHLILAINHPKDILHAKIEKRMDTWFRDGIFDEILMLHHDMHVPWSRLEHFGLEYKWCTRYVRGQVSLLTMKERTITDLKHYAKRQMTWIRRWKKQGAPIDDITTHAQGMKRVKTFLAQKSSSQ